MKISFPEEPATNILWKVEVASDLNSTFTFGVLIKKRPVVEATLVNDVVALLFSSSRFLNALVPIIVPENICAVVPFTVVVPLPAVNVPLLV